MFNRVVVPLFFYGGLYSVNFYPNIRLIYLYHRGIDP